ncbi:M23 family metallopeptidase [Novosphingobium sp. BL-8A]|uniref:M23 family metallopeptidase n=1 Tax=Novosphingobium sp. BL-8A TaxID=3127639 RepID=UPI003757079A
MPIRKLILCGCTGGMLLASPAHADRIDISSDDLERPAPVRPSGLRGGRASHVYEAASASGMAADDAEPIDISLVVVTGPYSGPYSGPYAAMPGGRPVRGGEQTSGFGMRHHPILGGTRFHDGVDLAAHAGDGVFATAGGRVTSAGWNGGYGLAVTVDHGHGVETRYAHLSRVNVAAGEEVRAGEILGRVGSTGLSTGPHLHYEMRRFGRPVDPATTLRR